MPIFSRASRCHRFRSLVLASGSLAVATLSISPAVAQDAVVEPTSTGSDTDEAIVVTGSRISRQGFNAPTPLVNLSSEELLKTGNGNVAVAINQLPALKSSITPETTSSYSAVLGGNFLDLRGLGYLRTLTLIDGQRYVPANPTGAINVNVIPQALLGGVDVVTGGASAAYGSDAVAGVVNLKLDDKLEGVRGSIQGGITDHDDYRNYTASIAAGTKFAGGRGHVIFGIEKARNNGIRRVSDRGWGAKSSSLINNPAYTAGNGQPQYLLVNDAHSSNASYGGLINSPGVLRGIQFANDGSAIPFRYGDLQTTSLMRGGDGIPENVDGVLVAPLKRFSTMGRVAFELTPDVTAFASGSYAKTSTHNESITGVDQITIRADNAYLPQSVRSVMAQNSIGSFVMGRSLIDYARGTLENDTKTWQVNAGLRGTFGAGWSWDASYGYGETDNFTLFGGARITARYLEAVDAVVNPANGAIVCRSSLTAASNGCSPLNLFGVGNASQQAINYVTGNSPRFWEIGQHVAQLNMRGEPFDTWAGPVSLAAGGEWRRQSVDVTSDAPSAARIYRVGNAQPWTGRQSVKEGFLEAVVPLARDNAFARQLDFNGAVRVTDYSTSGTVVTWKGGLTWDVSEWLRLRGTRSRDIRAPGLDELFATGSTLYFNVQDPSLNQTYSVMNIAGGNTGLKPEKADTLTLGLVLSPDAVPGLQISVDYYHITINDAIASLSTNNIVSQCFNVGGAACSLITRENGFITTIRSAPANLQSIKTKGIDFELAYSRNIGPGRLSFRALATYTDSLRLSGAGTNLELAGSTEQATATGLGGIPHWRGNVNISYATDAFTVGAVGRYVAGGLIDQSLTIDRPKISGRFYTDLNAEVALFQRAGHKVALFGGIRNAFDQDPPLSDGGTAAALYDVVGRLYTAGVRFAF